MLDEKPLEQPGYFYRMNRAYFDRIDAIEFAVSHDDGKRIEDLPRAEIILLGVSRVGKTPLSMYLSMLGWKVSNVPLVPDVSPPPALFTGDKHRLVGLMIEPVQLIAHRKARAARTGIPEGSYMGRNEVVEELRAASHFFYGNEIPDREHDRQAHRELCRGGAGGGHGAALGGIDAPLTGSEPHTACTRSAFLCRCWGRRCVHTTADAGKTARTSASAWPICATSSSTSTPTTFTSTGWRASWRRTAPIPACRLSTIRLEECSTDLATAWAIWRVSTACASPCTRPTTSS